MWQKFKNSLLESIVAVGEQYFLIKRYNADAAWRERAYCYELYHQLRSQLGDDFPYTLHGEIDKRRHRYICNEFENRMCPNPDYVVHRPGTADNLAVIEVKAADRLNRGDAIDDLKKVRTFIDRIGYQHGIFLIFGSASQPNEHSVPELIGGLEIKHPRITVLWHQTIGVGPDVLYADEEW